MDADFDPLDLFLEPRPDEEAWESYLDLALERIGGDRSPGLTNRQLADLEKAVGCMLPFEIGMLLVMGVPEGDGWWQWNDPVEDVARWKRTQQTMIATAVTEHEMWHADWGVRPDGADERVALASQRLDAAPATFPIHNDAAVPLSVAAGATSSDGNPVLRIVGGTVEADSDLAAFLHRTFEVPLPMWPTEDRSFEFWCGLTADGC